MVRVAALAALGAVAVTALGVAAHLPSSKPPPASPCPPRTPEAAAACVDAATYRADLELLAVERPPGSPGHAAAREHCRTVLMDLGFDVEMHDYGTGINVVGTKPGTVGPRTVVISGHYDSTVGCTGADDNATGTAGALAVARTLAAATWAQNLVVACWDEEEGGMVGSQAWANRAAAREEPVDVGVSLEMIGYRDDARGSQTLPRGFGLVFPGAVARIRSTGSRGDFIGLVSDPGAKGWARAFVKHAPESLRAIRVDVPRSLLLSDALRDLSRSDHAAFWAAGYPGVMVTDTANFRYGGYHCRDGEDTLDRLDTNFAVDVVRATAAATAARLMVDP